MKSTLPAFHTGCRYLFISNVLVFFTFFFMWAGSLSGQPAIDWQKTMGTEHADQALLLLEADHGHIVVVGEELHLDFTGNLRPYLMVMKVDGAGEEVWKSYHDIAFTTFHAPIDYHVIRHFYTEEWGETLINLLIRFPDRILLYKISDSNGDFFTWEDVSSSLIDVSRDGEKVYANVLCSVQASCYGPDSLVVEKFDPTPDSLVFDPIIWRLGLKQSIRTAPIQGHYDWSLQDIREDDQGNTFLLVQIQRWDFQFCTDCPDLFVDAWCEVFQVDETGQLVRHIRLKTASAVVSRMQFIGLREDRLLVQVQDINTAGTQIISTVYHLDKELNILTSFDLDKGYDYIVADDNMSLYGLRSVFDPANPDINGLSDVLVARYDQEGLLQWKGYYGGSSYDFPKGMVVQPDGSVIFLAHTESDDFDVENPIGGRDIWLVKLSATTVSTIEQGQDPVISLFPNPAQAGFYVEAPGEISSIKVYTVKGQLVYHCELPSTRNYINSGEWPSGTYLVQWMDNATGRLNTHAWIKAQ